MNRPNDYFISIVVPLRNDAQVLPSFVKEVMGILDATYSYYELVLIDDCSTDNTIEIISALLQDYRGARFLRLSKQFGREIAISAGLDSVIGDFVVIMDLNNDPPQLIPEMVTLAQSYNLVIGICAHKQNRSLLSRILSRCFYLLCERLLDIELQKDSTNFRVLSRKAVNAITRIKDKNRYLQVLSAAIGFSTITYPYQQIERAGQAKRVSLFERIEQGMSLIVVNSIRPLRLVSYLGALASLLNLLYIGYIVAINLFKAKVAEGWTTQSLQNTTMFFFIFIILVVLCEYVGRILEESKDRPLYYILEEKNSAVLVMDRDRPNIALESEVINEPANTD